MERNNQHYPLTTHPEWKFEILADFVELADIGDFGRVRTPAYLAL
jgi:hypothetical protein